MRQKVCRCVLVLLVTLLAVACYEPVDLSSSEDLNVPSVYCILRPADTLYLELRAVSRIGERPDGRGINNAVITLTEFEEAKDVPVNHQYRSSSFLPVGDGLYRIIFPGAHNHIKSGTICQLQVCLPSGDTLHAKTTMPDTTAVAQYVPVAEDPGFQSFEANGFKYEGVTYLSSQSGLYQRPDKVGYVFQPFDGVVYVSKVGWSKEQEGWFTEEELTTNREELTDAFNRTGTLFLHSDDPLAMKAFPDVSGKPLHYRYLRIPRRNTEQDTLFFTGDFKGPHYGEGWEPSIVLVRNWEQFVQARCQVLGLPFEPTMITTGKAGFLRFEFVSEEYDLYLKDLLLYTLLHNVSTDIVGIYDNTNRYSNIEGGVGIFGAKHEKQYYWSCGTWKF